jgi:hypothetical protein
MIRRLNTKSYAKFKKETKDTPVASRLKKVLSKDHTNGLGTLLSADELPMDDQK